MATKVIIHSPKGGQGKTTVTANVAMMLAGAGKRVLAVDADESESRGLGLYFNVQAEQGLSDLVAGRPLGELAGKVRDNLFFLPAGDLVQANRLIDQERATPNAVIEDRMAPHEDAFDFILFDTSPNSRTRLIFNLFYYCDRLVIPIETRRAGVDVLEPFMALVEGLLPRMRKPVGKGPLKVSCIVPYWHTGANASEGSLGLLQERYGALLTEPIRHSTALVEAWAKGQMLEEHLTRRPRDNEAQILKVFKTITRKLTAA